MERKGIPTDKGNYNREIDKFNNQLKQIKARIIKVQDWLKETKANTPHLLYDTLQAILTQGANDSNYAKIRNIQQASRVLNFITEHKISDLAELSDALRNLSAKRQAISDKLKPVDRRIKTLKEHLMHSENFKNYRKIAAKRDALYAKYNELSKQGLFSKGKATEALKKAEAYDWQYLNELQDFDKAETYLRGILQSRFDPKTLPQITAWERELGGLLTAKKHIQIEYDGLNAEVKSVENIRRYAEQVMRGDEDRERAKVNRWEPGIG
jgi:chromosome segregation ATPase